MVETPAIGQKKLYLYRGIYITGSTCRPGGGVTPQEVEYGITQKDRNNERSYYNN